MRFDLDLYHEVTCWPNTAEMALLANSEVHSVVHSLGDCNGLLHRVEDRALATASPSKQVSKRRRLTCMGF